MQATLSGTNLWTTLNRMTRNGCLFMLAIATMLLAPALHGQAVSATMSGTVTDPKGAVVQGATITLTDEKTHSERSTVTTKDGTFTLPDLVASTYTVKAVAQGFAPKALSGLDVHTGDQVRLPNISLAIGSTTDTVTVTSLAGQILQTENAQRTATLTYSDIQDIALQSRDTTELLKVLPGVVQVGNGATSGQGSSGGYNGLSVTTGSSSIGNGMGVNGAPYKGGTSLNMDGANVLDVGDDFSSLATVNPEMTQEVQVQQSNFGADESNGPVVVNTTGKAGGEHYHGEGYFDVRNDIMNANDWQDNHKGQAKSGAYYYYPGGSISGPIPHTNKKVFFFGGFELPLQNQGNANQINFTMMTPEMLNGDLSMDNADNQVLCPGGFYNNNNTIGVNSTYTANTTPGQGTPYSENSWCQNVAADGYSGSPMAPTAGYPGPPGAPPVNNYYTVFPDGSYVPSMNMAPVTTYYMQGNPATQSTVYNSYGGIIPQKWVDPNMQAFAKDWPGWNSGYVIKTLQGYVNNNNQNVHIPIQNSDNGWIARGRIDYNWNSTNQSYISYQQSYDHQLSGGCGVGLYAGCGFSLEFPGGGSITKTYSKILTGHYVHIFSPTLTNEALASWVWGNIPKALNNPSADYRSTLGASFGCYYCGVGQRFMPTFGSAVGYPGVGAGDVWEPNNYYIVQKAVVSFADNLTKVWGRHTLKFGASTSNTDNYQGSQTGAGMQGSFSFGGTSPGTGGPGGTNNNPTGNFFANQTTQPTNGCAVSVCNGYSYANPAANPIARGGYGSSNGIANYLMGNLSNYQETASEPLTDLAYQNVGIYANDQVKVSKKLTIEAGLRFEHIGAWYDRQGNGLAVFYPNRVLPDFYDGKFAPGFYWHAIDAGVPLSGKPNRLAFIEPRFGLSYDLFGNGKTTFRGGWGAYRYQEATNAPQGALNTAQGPTAVNFQGNSIFNQLPTPSTFLESQISQIKINAQVCQVQCSQGSGQTGFDPHDYGSPRTFSYNFTIDQRIPWGMLLEVGYVGNRTTQIQDTFGGNGDGSGPSGYDNQNKTPLGAYGVTTGAGQGSVYTPNPNGDPFTHRLVCNPESLNATCQVGTGTAPLNQDQDFRPFGRGTACTSAALANQTNCSVYNTQGVTMIGHHSYQAYNAAQAQLVKRAGPVTLNLNVTWSKSLGTETTFDPFHISSNNSYDNLQRPWVFNSSYIYREPNFWHGDRIIGGVVNGWTISGVTLWQMGSNTDGNINIGYDPATLPSFTGQSIRLGNGVSYSASDLNINNNSTGVGGNTFFGTNAGINTGRPLENCNPKSGLATYQLYRPCFTATQFGQPGGLGLHYVAGQAFMENDLALYKTFTIHEQNKVQFRITATNWLNHPTPTFAASSESTTQYYLYDYNTHALRVNDRCANVTAPVNVQVGSCNPGLSYVATTANSAPGESGADVFGQQHFKLGFGPTMERILELNVKYQF